MHTKEEIQMILFGCNRQRRSSVSHLILRDCFILHVPHRNHFRQSYVMQMHKVLAPVMARLGVKLVTHNFSQGGLGTLQNSMGAGDLYGKDSTLCLTHPPSAMPDRNMLAMLIAVSC